VASVEVSSAAVAVRPRGIGCFVAARREALGADFASFLARQRATDQAANWDASFPAHIHTTLTRATPTRAFARGELPEGMVAISGGAYKFHVDYRIRECGWYESSADAHKGLGKLHEMTAFERDVNLAPFAMDLTPVTNAEFARFLKASDYEPKEPTHFLRHWSAGQPPAGQDDHPVVYVDLTDARAYARWAGKRLPTEEEWQFAAQGTDGRKFPWGDQAPTPENFLCNATGSGTTPVKQFPAGRSPFGLFDLCGNTWEWTESERRDGVNRFAIVRGGSYYQARGSHWYMDGGPQEVSFGAKFLLIGPGLDRCATVGFRCVVDLILK